MSHFCVLVITPNGTFEEVRAALQPHHEFECTGFDDEFVKDVDRTAELREEYKTEFAARLRDSDGVLYSPYADRFYRDPTPEELAKIGPFAGSGCAGEVSFHSQDWNDGRGYRTKVRYVPEGFEEIDVPVCEFMTFVEYVTEDQGYPAIRPGETVTDEHKFGRTVLDADGNVVSVIRRTNPNKKWDYWTIGGRYAGRLISARDGYQKNSLRFGGIDFVAMKRDAVDKRKGEVWSITSRPALAGANIDEAVNNLRTLRAAWRELPEPRPRGEAFGEWLKTHPGGDIAAALNYADTWNYIDFPEGKTLSEWIDEAPALSAWAVLKDGQWLEKGEMGWFGMSHNELQIWPEQLQAILGTIRPDEHITVVDCHI